MKSPAAPVSSRSKTTAKPAPALRGEFLVVFAIALICFAVHLFCFRTPNITLIFDAQGFLDVTKACQKSISLDFVKQLFSFVQHGFPAIERASLLHQLGPVCDIVKTGHLLPVFLYCAYAIAGKSCDGTHWQVAATAMMLLQSLTVAMIWAVGKQSWNVSVGRLGAVLAILYSPFVLNATRPVSDVSNAFAVILAAWAIIASAQSVLWSKRESGSVETPAQDKAENSDAASVGFEKTKTENFWHKYPFASGTVLGISVTTLMLGRPTSLPVPLIITVVLAWMAKAHNTRFSLPKKTLVAAVASIVLCLAPWILCKWLIQGYPSITIDRYPTLNILTGCNLKSDGFDMLPGPYVAHPDRYTGTMAHSLNYVFEEFKTQPAAMLDLMLRKPGRLLTGPWNEFAVDCWGVPWVLQQWFHQMLLFLCGLGLFKALQTKNSRSQIESQLLSPDGLQSQSGLQSTQAMYQKIPAVVLGCAILFNFVNCVFITMRRYMFPMMPDVIVAAAYAIVSFKKEVGTRGFLRLLLVTAVFPTACLIVDQLASDRMPAFALLASKTGIEFVSLLVALTLSVILGGWFYYTSKIAAFGGILKRIWFATMCVVAVCCFASTRHSMKELEYNYKLDAAHPVLSTSIDVQDSFSTKNKSSHSCLLLLDAHRSDNSTDPLATLSVSLNGTPIRDTFRPLFELDSGQRENLIWERSFAASAGTDIEKIRQWWAVEIPTAVLQDIKSTHIDVRITNTSDQNAGHRLDPVLVSADFCTPGQPTHSLSIQDFSWTKGFLVDHIGDMRMDNWGTMASSMNGSTRTVLIPRVSLLVVDAKATESPTPTNGVQIQFPPTSIKQAHDKRMASYTVPGNSLASPALKAASTEQPDNNNNNNNNRNFNSLRLSISGMARTNAGKGTASCFMLENTTCGSTHTIELAPRAPLAIEVDKSGRHFHFEDIIPLVPAQRDDRFVDSSSRIQLNSVQLTVAGCPWWEILAYSKDKPKTPIEFTGLMLTSTPYNQVDLQAQHWSLINSNPVPLTQ